jgi:hypothetical protein
METRPLSKEKRWRLVEILEKAEIQWMKSVVLRCQASQHISFWFISIKNID